MVRRTLAAATLTAALMAALAGQALAGHTHLHCLTTPAGTHSIARGVTLHAPHGAFSNLHSNVHLGPFNPSTGLNPLSLVPDTSVPYDCPPSAAP